MKLPEQEIIYTLGMDIEGYGPFHIFGYTEAQMRQAIRDAYEDAAKVCKSISDEYREHEGRRFPELKTDAETGASDCEYAIRARSSND